MRKFFFTAGIILCSSIISSQEYTMYKLKEKVLLNEKECECYVLNGDTIDCRSEFINLLPLWSASFACVPPQP